MKKIFSKARMFEYFGYLALAGIIGLATKIGAKWDEHKKSFSGLETKVAQETNSNKVIDVPVARIRYSDGDILESMDFVSCSAVILDYQDKAVMAHAPDEEYANYMFEWGVLPEGDNIHIGNVVKHLSDEMQEKLINPKECKAFVNAGSERGIKKITNDLKEAGIKIESSKLDPNPRNIKYDPKTDKISVYYRRN